MSETKHGVEAAAALRAASALAKTAPQARRPADIHYAVASLVRLAQGDDEAAIEATVKLGLLCEDPAVAAKLAGWPWARAAPAAAFRGAALRAAVRAVACAGPEWASDWIAAGLAGARTPTRRALLGAAAAGERERGDPTRAALASASWAQADLALADAVAELAALTAQFAGPSSRRLRAQATLTLSALTTVSAARGMTLIGRVGASTHFDPDQHSAIGALAVRAECVYVTPGVRRGETLLRRPLVAGVRPRTRAKLQT